MASKVSGIKINESLHEINLGRVKVFLIKTPDNRLILVDTGMQSTPSAIVKYINSIGNSITDLKLIILTHAHIDHFGGAYYLQKLSGAHLAINENGMKYVNGEAGLLLPVARGSKSLSTKIMALAFPFILKFSKPHFVKPDMTLKEGIFPKDFGVKARILETPGHTKDSISIYLEDSKVVIVGDLLFGSPSKLVSPKFFEDYIALINSVKKVRDLSPDLICVSHGKDHNASDISI